MKTFQFASYKASFTSISEIMQHMQTLQAELQGTNLDNLRHFNATYLIITKNVFSKMKSDYFADENTMNNLDQIFACYYFDALKNYVDGKSTTPAWSEAFDFCQKGTSMPLIYLALGANAHVQNDLGLALRDVTNGNKFKPDYDKVNTVIAESIEEVITQLHVNQIYKPFMNFLIKHWRTKAWNNFKGLEQKTKTKNTIETHAFRQALELQKINNLKDFYHIYKVL